MEAVIDPLVRHAALRRWAHRLYAVPGMKPAVRSFVRFAEQSLPFSPTNQRRLYNFFAEDPALMATVRCRTQISGGPAVRLELDLDDWMSRIWYYWGYTTYETETVRLLRALIPFVTCLFDVGANVGYYTLLAASLLRGRGAVHAFEPIPVLFQRLTRNVALNAFSGVSLNPLALSDLDGHEPLYLPKAYSLGHASLIAGYVEQGGAITVETRRFDSHCRAASVSRVDLIKIDVEGAELRVLRGMGALLEAWWPDIICEVHAPFDRELDAFFRPLPYRKFLITDRGLREVDTIRADPDPVNRNYYLSRVPRAGLTLLAR